MKKFYLLFAVLLGVNFTSLASAEETVPADPATNAVMEMSPEQQEMMAKFQEYSTPGAEHEVLNALVGEWDHELKMWMEPGAEPEVSTGTTSTAWTMGGRFIEGRVTGTSMGQPFEGHSIMGYDKVKKAYVGEWYDNMATGIMHSTSTYDPATKTFNEEAVASCPLEGGDKHMRGVTKIIDDNTYAYEMYTNDKDGKEFKMMEITYKKK